MMVCSGNFLSGMCYSKLPKLEVLYNVMTKWENLFDQPRRQYIELEEKNRKLET